jgi:hypothetical protein
MFKSAIQTIAAAVVAVGCLTVSADAGHKGGHGHSKGHSGHHASHVGGHGTGMVRSGRHYGGGHGYHHGHRYGSAVAVGIASGLVIGSAVHASSVPAYYASTAWPAGKGCGPTYRPVYQPVAVTSYRPVVTTSVVAYRAPVCVCD